MSRKHRVSPTLRQRIAEVARFRCGYCQTAQRVIGPLLEVEHIVPVALGGKAIESNLWLACPMCNGHKSDKIRADDPETHSAVPLFNPRTENWHLHFEWIKNGSVVRGITPTGRATAEALAMNHPDIVAARRLWVAAGWHPPID